MDNHIVTKLIHANLIENGYCAVAEPIVMSTTFLRDTNGEFADGQDIYTRGSNPNRNLLEKKLALLENGSQAVCFSSGQAATLSIFHCLNSGDHVILPDDIYYGTKLLLEKIFSQYAINFSVVDMCDLAEIEKEILPQTKLIWIETPSNPKLKICDISEIVKLAKNKAILTVADNTWASPYHCQPFSFGVDLVMHSTTKYLGGHSDLLGGVIIANDKSPTDLIDKIRIFQHLGGAVPSPFDCWLLMRSLATFYLRMPVHASNAMLLAEFLNNHAEVEQVFYPGLEDNLYHNIAQKQMINGFGGMLSVLIKGSEKKAIEVAAKLKVFKNATSLGGVESLVDHRRTAEGQHSTSQPNLLRISVGIENIEDLIRDFNNALI